MPDVEVSLIRPSTLNPRSDYPESAMDNLVESIRQVGLVEPIVVRRRGDGYEIVAGERRFRAAVSAGLTTVPVVVRDYSDDEVLAVNIVENLHREDLTVVEKARVCKMMRERWPSQFDSWGTVAQKVGVSASTVENWVRTLELPEPIQARIGTRAVNRMPAGKIDYTTALSLGSKVEDESRQIELAEELAGRNLPRRVARRLISKVAREPGRKVKELVEEGEADQTAVLPFSRSHAEAIEMGSKTQTARKSKDPRIKIGSKVRVMVGRYLDVEVTALERKELSEFTEEDAQREGSYSLAEFKGVWKDLHGNWDPLERVYVLRFQPLDTS